MLWSGGGFSHRSIFRLTNKIQCLKTCFSAPVRPICGSALGLVAQGNFRGQEPFQACKSPALPRSLIDCNNLRQPKSSSPQMPLEDMEIIYTVSAGLMIIEGLAKELLSLHFSFRPLFLPAGPFPCPEVVCACGLSFSSGLSLSSGADLGS